MNSLVKVVPNLKKFNDYIFDVKDTTATTADNIV